MRVWLINSSEAVPLDEGRARLRRTGLLGEVLSARGHDILWWSSTFQHAFKTQRYDSDTVVDVRERYKMQFLRGPGYRRNISLARLWDHRQLGRGFRRLAPVHPRPDVVLCSFPTLKLSDEATRYGKQHGVPVVLDVRDMWPDVIAELMPRGLRWAGRAALAPLYRIARRACAAATAITGHAPGFVEWGLEMGDRRRGPLDRHFPFGYQVEPPTPQQQQQARQFWQEHGLGHEADGHVVCFFGLVGHQFDLETVIEAARSLGAERGIRFAICGPGARLEHYRGLAADCPHVVFPGWVNAAQIWTLLRMSFCGLAPYVRKPNFEAGLTNKPIEYLSAGVPILTSLGRGILCDLLEEHDCGISYGTDASRLAETIAFLHDNPRRRQLMAANAAKLFESQFTAPKVYGDMADYLEEVVGCWARFGTVLQ